MEYEHEHEGVVTLLLVCAPLVGHRRVTVTARRTRTDQAHPIGEFVDVRILPADRPVLVRAGP